MAQQGLSRKEEGETEVFVLITLWIDTREKLQNALPIARTSSSVCSRTKALHFGVEGVNHPEFLRQLSEGLKTYLESTVFIFRFIIRAEHGSRHRWPAEVRAR